VCGASFATDSSFTAILRSLQTVGGHQQVVVETIQPHRTLVQRTAAQTRTVSVAPATTSDADAEGPRDAPQIRNTTSSRLLHPFNGPLSGTTRVSRYQKGKTSLDLLEQEIVSGSGIIWTICKSAPLRSGLQYSARTRMPGCQHQTTNTKYRT